MGSFNATVCLNAFRDYVRSVYDEEFGIRDEAISNTVAEDWFFCDGRHEHRFSELKRRLPKANQILDLASGMGTAVLYGLSQGFDMFGIEPDARKLRFTRNRIDAGEMPQAWKRRFSRAVGETLPFHDGVFDAVLSYQTLEHVQDLEAVLFEIVRVVKSGGALSLRCPDYWGTFEGHYLLPWLPLMPRPVAKIYLRLLGRPLAGFESVRYTTKSGIIGSLRAAEKVNPGLRVKIIDLGKERFLRRLREIGLPPWSRIYPAWKLFRYFQGLFRREQQIDLWVQVLKNSPIPTNP